MYFSYFFSTLFIDFFPRDQKKSGLGWKNVIEGEKLHVSFCVYLCVCI